MRKLILIILLLAALPLLMLAQSPSTIGRNANLSIFAGYYAQRQNSNSNGNWIGVYGDVPLYRSASESWNFGIWGLYAKSKWTNNLGPYTSTSNDFALGFNGGYYSEFFSYKHNFYSGLAIGYKRSKEIGIVEKRHYQSEGHQTDDMIVGNINLNLMKYSGYRPHLLPRTQLILIGQSSLHASKVLSENDSLFKTISPWDKGYVELIFKQSIFDIPLGYAQSYFLQPKVGAQYSRYQAGDPNAYAYLVELSLHKAYTDDLLSITFMQKFSPGKDYLFIMLNVNLLKF